MMTIFLSLSAPRKLIVGLTLGAKFATALTSDEQLRRELAISGIPENDISHQIS